MSVGFKLKWITSLSDKKGIFTGLVLHFIVTCLAITGAQMIKKDPCITDYSFSRNVGKFAIQHLTQPDNFLYIL